MTDHALGARRSALGSGLGTLRLGVVAVAGALALGACGGDTGPHVRVPTQLEAVSDTVQLVPAGTDAPDPPVVRVVDRSGNPVRGATVHFRLTQGGGELRGETQFTDAAGVALLTGWTVDTAVGTEATVTATAWSADSALSPLLFRALSTGPVRYGFYDTLPPGSVRCCQHANYMSAYAVHVRHDMTLTDAVLFYDAMPTQSYYFAMVSVGLYGSDATGRPDTLVVPSVSVRVPPPGALRVPFPATHLPAGTYWLAMNASDSVHWLVQRDSEQVVEAARPFSYQMPDSFPLPYTGLTFTWGPALYIEGTIP